MLKIYSELLIPQDAHYTGLCFRESEILLASNQKLKSLAYLVAGSVLSVFNAFFYTFCMGARGFYNIAFDIDKLADQIESDFIKIIQSLVFPFFSLILGSATLVGKDLFKTNDQVNPSSIKNPITNKALPLSDQEHKKQITLTGPNTERRERPNNNAISASKRWIDDNYHDAIFPEHDPRLANNKQTMQSSLKHKKIKIQNYDKQKKESLKNDQPVPVSLSSEVDSSHLSETNIVDEMDISPKRPLSLEEQKEANDDTLIGQSNHSLDSAAENGSFSGFSAFMQNYHAEFEELLEDDKAEAVSLSSEVDSSHLSETNIVDEMDISPKRPLSFKEQKEASDDTLIEQKDDSLNPLPGKISSSSFSSFMENYDKEVEKPLKNPNNLSSSSTEADYLGLKDYLGFNDPDAKLKEEKYTSILLCYRQKLVENNVIEEVNLEIPRSSEQNIDLQPVAGMLSKLFDFLDKVVKENGDSHRHYYYEYVWLLREIIDSHNKMDADKIELLKPIVDKICFFRFVPGTIWPYLKRIVDASLASHAEPLNQHSFPKALAICNQIISRSNKLKKPVLTLALQKGRGALSIQDFGLQNTPHVREVQVYAKDGVSFNVNYLRHSTPHLPGSLIKTMLGYDTGEVVAPDYKRFIEHALKNQQSVLYVIHQNRIKLHSIENETTRVKTLESLQDEYKNFHAFCQPMDGYLFKLKIIDIKEFKDEILANFIEGTHGCSLPKCLTDNDDYKQRVLSYILDEVHDIFFNKATCFDEKYHQKAKMIFLLLFYVFQRVDLKFRLSKEGFPVTYYTTACKDFLDRGGVMALIEDVLQDYILGNQDKEERIKENFYNILGPPILVKKQAVIQHRLMDGVMVISYLDECFHNDKDRYNKIKGYNFGKIDGKDWRLTNTIVDKN
ncbi:MAG: hypothetical protein ACOVOR_03935 [Rhabdochlamydiaceae bacterium]